MRKPLERFAARPLVLIMCIIINMIYQDRYSTVRSSLVSILSTLSTSKDKAVFGFGMQSHANAPRTYRSLLRQGRLTQARTSHMTHTKTVMMLSMPQKPACAIYVLVARAPAQARMRPGAYGPLDTRHHDPRRAIPQPRKQRTMGRKEGAGRASHARCGWGWKGEGWGGWKTNPPGL